MKKDTVVNILVFVSAGLIVAGVGLFSWKLGLIASGIVLFFIATLYGAT